MRINEKVVMEYNGQNIIQYEIQNKSGFQVNILSLGGTITEIMAPDREGKFENVVLRYKDLETYKINAANFGSIIGRTAGRIKNAKFNIDGIEYNTTVTGLGNTLHGGKEGFNLKNWAGSCNIVEDEAILKLKYTSKDGEEGFPGNVEVTVTYIVNENNELKIVYEGVSDKKTLLNLTNHSYFNLSGEGKRSIEDHIFFINSDKVYELDETSVPNGNIINVEGTPFDFRVPKKIGRDIDDNHPQLISVGGGYDHPWILNNSGELKVDLLDEESGRGVKVYTDFNDAVIYTMNFGGEEILSNNQEAKKRYAVCIETQNAPIGKDNLNLEDSLIEAGEKYRKETIFKFYCN